MNFNLIKNEIHNKLIKNKININQNIISSIILYNIDNNEYKIISITCGSQVLNTYCNNKVKDFHAEMLCIHNFRYFAYNNKKYFVNNVITSKLKLASKYKLLLYCNKLPCGDCSIIINSSNKIIEQGKSKLYNNILDNLKYNKRLKPCRSDINTSNINTNILSCTDKLIKYMITGIQGSYLSNIFDNIKIDLYIFEYSNINNLKEINKEIIIKNTINSFNIKNRLLKINKKYLKYLKNIKIKTPKIKIIYNSNNNIINLNNLNKNPVIIDYEGNLEILNYKTGLKQGANPKCINNNTISKLIKFKNYLKNIYGKDSDYTFNKEFYKYFLK